MTETENPPILRRAIPSTGELIPAVGCGTWQTFDVTPDERTLEGPTAVVSAMLESGGSVIDTSPMYARAEQVTGSILSDLHARDRSFLATKVWTRGRQAGIAEMQRSFDLLRSPVIDLMQVHNLVDWQVHLPVLKEWKAEGRIRYLGVTHYTDSAHADLEVALRTGEFDFVQVNYSLLDRGAERRLLPAANDLGVAVLVNRPFGEGSLIRRLAQKPLPPIASELGCGNWADLALRFILSNDAVTCAIPATSSVGHMRDNMKSAAGRLMSASERARLLSELG